MYIVSHFQAEACRSVAQAIKKCPNGMYAEIKYDGERVQVHKQGDRFEFFSRSLKPVQPHKVLCVWNVLGLLWEIPGYSHAQTPPSHRKKGLVTIDRFLGCVESAVFFLNKPIK